ncbi:MAG: glycine--tRNA ligase subunit beta, partial [Acidobacteria bacterium]|nr:glycine--tRNA ligase subunit beta [Acidobacteriota bacterium]
MKVADFLLEIGVEEVPDWMITGALADLKRLFLEVFPGVEVETHATPRRLVLSARGLPAKQPDTKETVTGPPASAGPNAAAGFARKMGCSVEDLVTVVGGQASRFDVDRRQESRFDADRRQDSRFDESRFSGKQYYAFTRKIKGRRAVDILSEKLPGVILGIAWPKTMTWSGKSGPRFIRPIRWL